MSIDGRDADHATHNLVLFVSPRTTLSFPSHRARPLPSGSIRLVRQGGMGARMKAWLRRRRCGVAPRNARKAVGPHLARRGVDKRTCACLLSTFVPAFCSKTGKAV